MDGILIEVSCVVTANAHNPSILNPDWLKANGILPEDLSWDLAGPAIVTPPLSHVGYQNGVAIVLESGKLSITLRNVQSYDGSINPSDVVREIGERYITVLPHIPYGAVGNNCKIMLEREDASQKLIRAFGSNGPWKKGLSGVQTKLSYDMANSLVRNVEINAATISKASEENPPEEVEIILFAVNCHRDAKGDEGARAAVSLLTDDVASSIEYTSKTIRSICA